MYYIYCFTNKINNKKYIGSTINEPNIRYKQHLYHVNNKTTKSDYPLYSAIRKYGIENFSFEVIDSGEWTEKELRTIEKNYITKYKTISPFGYNQTDNTEHPINSIESYKKMSETKREQAKAVAIFDLQGNLLNIYRSIVDCAEATGFNERKIAACCRGERKTSDNHIFYWVNENNDFIIPEYHRDPYKGENGTTQQQITNKKVAKIDIETNEILATYDSIALAARENECDASGISKVCRGIRNTTKGYKWKYV